MTLQAIFRKLRRHVDQRAALRHADRVLARCRRRPNPGYDELRQPVFALVMLAAVAALVLDVRGQGREVLAWALAVIDSVRAWA